MISLKLYFNRTTRRASISEEKATYDGLRSLVVDLGILPSDKPFSLKWKDEDNEVISMGCDLEVKEAINVMVGNGDTPRFIVCEEPDDKQTTTEMTGFVTSIQETVPGIRIMFWFDKLLTLSFISSQSKNLLEMSQYPLHSHRPRNPRFNLFLFLLCHNSLSILFLVRV